MEDNKLNDMLKSYFSNRIDTPEKGPDCPSNDTLAGYVSGNLKPEELFTVSSHIKACPFCSELIEGALLYSAYEKHINLEKVPDKVKNKAKSLNPAHRTMRHTMITYLKKNVWITASLVSLIASFFIPRYFVQFIILAAIFGLKWVFNRESTRTLIMIYNAWKRHDKDVDKELEQIFKNRK